MSTPALVTDHPDTAPTYTDPAFRPLALAMGQFVLAWNGLHERLGMLFWTVTGGGWGAIPLAVWHSIKSDRQLRDMLIAAAETAYANKAITPENVCADIKWITDTAQGIENLRNDILHSPFVLHHRGDDISVLAGHHFGHKNAKRLSEKDVLKELRWARKTVTELIKFSAYIDSSICNPLYVPWSKRPKLPNRGDKRQAPRKTILGL